MRYEKGSRFELHDDHITLLKNAYIRWEDCEFGAPAIDCKRPYGNSSVVPDILEILEVEPVLTKADEGDIFSDDQEAYAIQVHRELEAALTIILGGLRHYTGPGVYERVDDSYSRGEWSYVGPLPEDFDPRP